MDFCKFSIRYSIDVINMCALRIKCNAGTLRKSHRGSYTQMECLIVKRLKEL
ncbi:hypothetical protein HanIR_Chr04g0174031 [Helianthus annuus]|nr:hypothetical protein HanIR_Chr04g0174031 [Helianthus annuus]